MTAFQKAFIGVFIVITLFLPNLINAKINGVLENAIKLFREQKYDEAKKIFEQIASENPENPEPLGYLGQIYLIKGDYDNSIKWYNKAINLEQNNGQYHFRLGQAYDIKAQRANICKKAGAAKIVKKEFYKAEELDSMMIAVRIGLMQYYLMAPGIMGGDKEKAKEQAAEIKKLNQAQGHFAFGLVYEQEKKLEDAEKEYLSAIEINPDVIQFHYNLARYYDATKQYNKAFEIYEKILQKNQSDLTAYYQIGKIASISGQNLIRGEDCLIKFIELRNKADDTSTSWAHYRLGKIYEKQNKKDKAKLEYKTALKINPDHKQAKTALKKLK